MTTAIVSMPDVSDGLSLVLDGLTAIRSTAVYRAALHRFLDWRERIGNPPFSKRLVQRYRADLVGAGYAPATVNLALCTVRKLSLEASDNGYLDPNVAAAIGRVPGVHQGGRRVGNWLDREEASSLLGLPDPSTTIGLRDLAILAVMLGAGLRRAEVVSLQLYHFQRRDGRWVILDLVGKGSKIRTVPIPLWVKRAVSAWCEAAGITEGLVFRRVRVGGKVGASLSDRSIYDIVARYSDVAPHDLRRTWAKLAHKGGAPIEQISLSLGHSSILTTEKYLGVDQALVLGEAPCDFLGLEGRKM